MPTIGIQNFTQLFNAVLLKGYFPAQEEVARIILIPKARKLPSISTTNFTSTKPIWAYGIQLLEPHPRSTWKYSKASIRRL
jgi:hypothetical protein